MGVETGGCPHTAIREDRLGAHCPAHPGENDKANNEFADDRTSSRAQAISLLHELASPPNERTSAGVAA